MQKTHIAVRHMPEFSALYNLRSCSTLDYVIEPDTILNTVAHPPHNSFTTKIYILCYFNQSKILLLQISQSELQPKSGCNGRLLIAVVSGLYLKFILYLHVNIRRSNILAYKISIRDKRLSIEADSPPPQQT